jgi:hypothetical protein
LGVFDLFQFFGDRRANGGRHPVSRVGWYRSD